ncbi:hypothetical protein ACLOJK_031819 [Asimina triloba]
MDTADASGDGSGGRLRPQAGAMMADGVFHGGGGALRWRSMVPCGGLLHSSRFGGDASTDGKIVVCPISSGDEQQMDPRSISAIFMICP